MVVIYQLHEAGWRLSGGCNCVLCNLKRESGCLNYLR